MRLSTLSFLGGILICQTLSKLPDIHWFLLLFPLVLLVRVFPTLKILLFLALGFFWAVWRAEMILTQELAPVLEKQEITVIGKVIDLPHYKDKKWRFDFVPSQLIFNGQNQALPGKIRLSWENKQYSLRPGQQWQFTVRLKRPHGTINPGSADYSAKLFQQRIRATGSVRKKGDNRLLAETSKFSIDLLRYHIAETLKQAFKEHPSVGILIALSIGDGNAISAEQWEIFRRTGTTHLVVISGLQISAVAIVIFILASWLWRWMGPTALWLPTPYFAVFVSLIAALFYSLLAGFSIPVQRAFIMVAIGVLSTLSGRIVITHKLALALLLVSIYDPFAVITIGFWLSFGTVAIIIYTVSGHPSLSAGLPQNRQSRSEETWLKSSKKWIQRRWQTPNKAFRIFTTIQIAITLCLTPVILFIYGDIFIYGGIFPVSFIANFIAIQIVDFIVVPMILFSLLVIPLFQKLSYLLLSNALNILDSPDYSLMNFLGYLSNAVSNDGQFSISPFIPSLWVTLVALIGAIILLLPRGFPGRWLGLIGFLPLFSLPLPQLQPNEIEFTLLDVGQGLASVIRTQNHVLIYDTGLKHDNLDMGQLTVLPFLRSQQIQHIDTLIISHLEIDHYGGSSSLLKNIPVGKILTSSPEKAKKLGITQTAQRCQLGQQWQWDGVQFEILHPPINYVANNNNSSCLLKVSVGHHAILLPGDIGKAIEYRLVQYYQQHLQADILIAPHHGSRYSSSEAFIEAVHPKLVLFSAGYLNNFNHPHPQTQERYQRRGIQLLRTDSAGAITLHLAENGITNITLARDQMRRYWHDGKTH
ncbi:MAG: DNA internalization-related competence protein ComEC/Rec2 [Beggiatoa sp. IS2]|nr:MAG: DNA internalization-related competence protein ComEC/Rec2 [Beggiatoa sp. IS2]